TADESVRGNTIHRYQGWAFPTLNNLRRPVEASKRGRVLTGIWYQLRVTKVGPERGLRKDYPLRILRYISFSPQTFDDEQVSLQAFPVRCIMISAPRPTDHHSVQP